ncbi:hypothetical protein SETIT_8G156100v2 [Setaria italica]|uniref:Peptidase C1A papain C-terminal domain-containing protein n=1 Tax=Setaria italica TaxID=4555 RepID=K3ZLF2_SETIT|nr:hypothetical protein SETIT_8G156100v2 [Setaria italica]
MCMYKVSATEHMCMYNFQHYYGGMYKGRCFWNVVYIGATVGYGTEPGGTKYRIGKNSWSGSWGDKGFVYLLRDSARVGVRGVAQQACYPTI